MKTKKALFAAATVAASALLLAAFIEGAQLSLKRDRTVRRVDELREQVPIP